jgi:protein involved in polysaccharide export with SLBB domain
MNARLLILLPFVTSAALAQGAQRPVSEPGASITMPVIRGPSDPEVLAVPERAPPPTQGQGPPPLPMEAPVDPDRYLCGRGDIFELNFWGAQNFHQRLVIDMEGRSFLPRIGYLNLVGKTLSQVRTMVRQAVAEHLPGVRFDLSLAEPRIFLVHVVGAVLHPGAVEARAVERVSAVLRRAGGELPNASRRHIEIERGQARIPVDLIQYEATGDTRLDPTALDGDIIHVFFEGRTVLLSGALAGASAPEDAAALRRMPWVRGDTARSLLERVGGVSPNAELKSAYVQSIDGTAARIDLEAILIRNDPGADRAVGPGDALIVPWRRREVAVLGAVAKSGSFPFTPGMTVPGYIALAGGGTQRAGGDVRVLSTSGAQKRVAEGLILSPGDTVVVPERTFLPSEVVQIIIGGVSLGLGATALFLAVHH